MCYKAHWQVGQWALCFFYPLFIIPYFIHCIHVVLVGSNCTNSVASQQKCSILHSQLVHASCSWYPSKYFMGRKFAEPHKINGVYIVRYSCLHVQCTCYVHLNRCVCSVITNSTDFLSCSFVFKLADFGTARELAPGETFFSLHGTEEYLYPGMYERALVNPQKKKNFQAKVSKEEGFLW